MGLTAPLFYDLLVLPINGYEGIVMKTILIVDLDQQTIEFLKLVLPICLATSEIAIEGAFDEHDAEQVAKRGDVDIIGLIYEPSRSCPEQMIEASPKLREVPRVAYLIQGSLDLWEIPKCRIFKKEVGSDAPLLIAALQRQGMDA